MLSPSQQMAILQEHKRDLLRQARLHRLLSQAEHERPLLGERLMALLGDLMISSGQRLKGRSNVRSNGGYPVEAQNW